MRTICIILTLLSYVNTDFRLYAQQPHTLTAKQHNIIQRFKTIKKDLKEINDTASGTDRMINLIKASNLRQDSLLNVLDLGLMEFHETEKRIDSTFLKLYIDDKKKETYTRSQLLSLVENSCQEFSSLKSFMTICLKKGKKLIKENTISAYGILSSACFAPGKAYFNDTHPEYVLLKESEIDYDTLIQESESCSNTGKLFLEQLDNN